MHIAITGATSGIGEALALQLAAAGHSLVVTGRDPARLASIASRTNARALAADLSTLAGARTLAAELTALPRLDVLVHNAGILPTERVLTADGFEASFATNHLAPFVINRALLARPPSRIVQVSAGLYAAGTIDLASGPFGQPFHPFKTYGTSKLWNLYATFELAKQLPAVPISYTHLDVYKRQPLRRPTAPR